MQSDPTCFSSTPGNLRRLLSQSELSLLPSAHRRLSAASQPQKLHRQEAKWSVVVRLSHVGFRDLRRRNEHRAVIPADGAAALADLSDRGGPQDSDGGDRRPGRQRAAEPDHRPGQSGRLQERVHPERR
ncbi:uncharacterized protein sdhaf1 isoform X2 [Siniperca chuatsi]|uniref:uncharacterized protein sdhaf1 isoform X2 n=1 Tax=Siniperca chuatsi TaxID=119488 RepID=UPI001CE0C771|nr:uncharacterized protein sdhaf1 isoform X2 [Siniperca chuatsi]